MFRDPCLPREAEVASLTIFAKWKPQALGRQGSFDLVSLGGEIVNETTIVSQRIASTLTTSLRRQCPRNICQCSGHHVI